MLLSAILDWLQMLQKIFGQSKRKYKKLEAYAKPLPPEKEPPVESKPTQPPESPFSKFKKNFIKG